MKFVQCFFGILLTIFTGIWVLDIVFQFFWIVVSNEIELEILKGMIEVKVIKIECGIVYIRFQREN